MTFTPVSDFTPEQRVAAALYKVVDGSFREGLDQNGIDWMMANKATAAKVYRFHFAMAWFWAAMIIEAENISQPSPDEFMTQFREAAFTKILTEFFPGMAERDGGKLLWGMMNMDAERTPDLIEKVLDRKPPYLTHAIFKEWMAAQGVNIDLGTQFATWMITSAAAGTIQEKVRAALKAGD